MDEMGSFSRLPDGARAPTNAGASPVPGRYFEIEAGDDARAAEIMLGELGGRLKNCKGRFFVRKLGSVVFEEGEDRVRNEIMNMTNDNVVIMAVHMDKVPGIRCRTLAPLASGMRGECVIEQNACAQLF